MKILGVGVDIIKNDRLKILIRKKNFILRTFTKNEINFSKKKIQKYLFLEKDSQLKSLFLNP